MSIMASKSTKKKSSAETSPKPAQDAEIRQENIEQRSHIGAVGGAAAGAATGAAFGSVVPPSLVPRPHLFLI